MRDWGYVCEIEVMLCCCLCVVVVDMLLLPLLLFRISLFGVWIFGIWFQFLGWVYGFCCCVVLCCCCVVCFFFQLLEMKMIWIFLLLLSWKNYGERGNRWRRGGNHKVVVVVVREFEKWAFVVTGLLFVSRFFFFLKMMCLCCW